MKYPVFLLMALLLVGSALATPLSVVESEYLNFDSTIAGPVWLVNVRGDNDASYTVFGDTADLEATTTDGETVAPKNDFTLQHSIESESCEYGLLNTNRNDIYQYEITQTGNNVFFTRADDLIDECYNSPGGVLAWGRTTLAVLTRDVYCLRETEVANAGEVLEGKINFDASFSLQKGTSNPIVKTISTLASNAEEIPSRVTFSDGRRTVARIRWIGGTTFGETCPGQDDFVAIEKDNEWFTADKDAFILYNDQYQQLQELISKIKNTNEITSDERRDVERLVQAANERGQAAMVEKDLSIAGQRANIEGSTAKIQLPRDHLIYAPDFQIILSADWLGFVFQSSKPKIVDADFKSCTEEGGDNAFYVTVKNVGAKEGTFDVGATCQEGLSVSGTTRSIKLGPEESGTITMPFTVDLDQDLGRSCTVIVADRIDIDKQDRKLISTSCQASTFCSVEGRLECFGEVEKTCDGGQWVETGSDNCLTSICNRDSTCDVDDGESFEACGGKLASDNDCATCNLNGVCEATETVYSCSSDCGEIKKPIAAWVYWVGGIALAVMVYFGLGMIPQKGKKKGGKPKRRRK
jgi:ribosomal protein S13